MSFLHVITVMNVREPLSTLAAGECQRSSPEDRRKRGFIPRVCGISFCFLFFYFHLNVTQSPIVLLAAETNDDESFGSLQQETRPFSNEC